MLLGHAAASCATEAIHSLWMTFVHTGISLPFNIAHERILQILDKESLVNSSMVTKIKQEIRILKKLRHPNVVELKEVLASRQQIFMVMELVPGGELFDKIIAEGPMSVSTIMQVSWQNQVASNGFRQLFYCNFFQRAGHTKSCLWHPKQVYIVVHVPAGV